MERLRVRGSTAAHRGGHRLGKREWGGALWREWRLKRWEGQLCRPSELVTGLPFQQQWDASKDFSMKVISRLTMAVTWLQWSFEWTKEDIHVQTRWYGPSLCLANEFLLPRGRVGTDPAVTAGGLLLSVYREWKNLSSSRTDSPTWFNFFYFPFVNTDFLSSIPQSSLSLLSWGFQISFWISLRIWY